MPEKYQSSQKLVSPETILKIKKTEICKKCTYRRILSHLSPIPSLVIDKEMSPARLLILILLLQLAITKHWEQ
ncbi:hypothetical protein WUBG_08820, partial [Wuchereria bancrofti]